MLHSALSPQEQALIPTHISSVTDALIILCGCAQPYATTAIEKIWGRPITVLPAQKRQPTKTQILDNLLMQLESRRGCIKDPRKFHSVLPNPRRLNSKLGKRYDLIREGMTVGEYLNRGGSLRDIAKGLRRGHFSLEDTK